MARLAVPALFGLTLLLLWEMAVRLYDVPAVILPAPSAIGAAVAGNLPTLWADFVQTFVPGRAVRAGPWGAPWRSWRPWPWPPRASWGGGLLPVGNFMAALPIVGTAPILVMWVRLRLGVEGPPWWS